MSARVPFADLSAMHAEIADELEAAIRRVCSSNAFIGGREVKLFEEAWAEFTGARRAVGVANGTDAIELVLVAAGLPRGSEVVVPANTFIATAEAVVAAGHVVRFVDVEPASGLIDMDALGQAVEDGAKAAIPVHLYGRVVDMERVRAICQPRGVLVIEDAAQAHAARLGGRHAGTFGVAGTFSFYPGKNLGAFGDAGALITDDDGLADTVELLRDHGRKGPADHTVVGVNSRLDGLQAAVLAVKLEHLERWTAARHEVARGYRSSLPPGLLDWPGHPDPAAESHHVFPILVEDRERLETSLNERGIGTNVHYRLACPTTTAFGGRVGEFPVAERRAAHQLSLPMYPHMSSADVALVADAIHELDPQ